MKTYASYLSYLFIICIYFDPAFVSLAAQPLIKNKEKGIIEDKKLSILDVSE